MEPQPARPRTLKKVKTEKNSNFVEFIGSSLLDSDLNIERHPLFSSLCSMKFILQTCFYRAISVTMKTIINSKYDPLWINYENLV